MKATLLKHGLDLQAGLSSFETLDAALEHAEEAMLRAAKYSEGGSYGDLAAGGTRSSAVDLSPKSAGDPTLALRRILSDYVVARNLANTSVTPPRLEIPSASHAPAGHSPFTQKHRSDYALGRNSSTPPREKTATKVPLDTLRHFSEGPSPPPSPLKSPEEL